MTPVREPPQITSIESLAEAIFFGFNPSRLPKKGAQSTSSRPFIHVKDVTDGVLPPIESLGLIEIPDSGQNDRLLLRAGDVLVSARGTLMKCALVEREHEGAVASANFLVLRPKQIISPALLWTFLNSPAIQTRMMGKSRGSVQPSLNIGDFQSLEITVPPRHIQLELVHLTSASERQYRAALECARLCREEAFDLAAQFLEPIYED